MNAIYKKNFLLMGLCLLLNVTAVMGQTSFSIDKLTNKEWIWSYGEKIDAVCINRYTNMAFVNTTTFNKSGECFRVENFYYLSNERDTVFDINKVGKTTEGKYIIRSMVTSKTYYTPSLQELKGSKAWCCEILKLTDDEFVMRNKLFGEDDIPMFFKLKK